MFYRKGYGYILKPKHAEALIFLISYEKELSHYLKTLSFHSICQVTNEQQVCNVKEYNERLKAILNSAKVQANLFSRNNLEINKLCPECLYEIGLKYLLVSHWVLSNLLHCAVLPGLYRQYVLPLIYSSVWPGQ